MDARKIAVAIPALNEADRIRECLTAFSAQASAPAFGRLTLVVLANNCTDRTAAIARQYLQGVDVDVREVSLLPPHNHAGWARRYALECAAEALTQPDDVLLSTDADTIVAADWVARNLAYIDGGFDAVAGFAMPHMPEWKHLDAAHRDRFNRLRKYHTMLAYLRSERHSGAHDPWPRHEYEGGASIALTFGMYCRIAPVPAPPNGEDKALFEAVRRAGGRIRHPLDVKAYTSCRYVGRAPGGMADTIAEWGCQSQDAPLHGAWPLNVELGHGAQARSMGLTFAALDSEIEKARQLVRSMRLLRRLRVPA